MSIKRHDMLIRLWQVRLHLQVEKTKLVPIKGVTCPALRRRKTSSTLPSGCRDEIRLSDLVMWVRVVPKKTVGELTFRRLVA